MLAPANYCFLYQDLCLFVYRPVKKSLFSVSCFGFHVTFLGQNSIKSYIYLASQCGINRAETHCSTADVIWLQTPSLYTFCSAIYVAHHLFSHVLVKDLSADVTSCVFPVGHLTAPLLKSTELLGPCVHSPLHHHHHHHHHLTYTHLHTATVALIKQAAVYVFTGRVWSVNMIMSVCTCLPNVWSDIKLVSCSAEHRSKQRWKVMCISAVVML